MTRSPLLVALLAAGLSGCVATQRDVIELENQTDELKFQILELKKTIGSLQGSQADLSVNMGQLHTDIGVFTETVKELQTNVDRLGSKLDDLGSGITSVGAGIASKVTALSETLKETEARQQSEAAAKAKALAEAKAKAPPSATEIFHTAEVRLARKEYTLAIKGFESYIETYPDGALIDVALFNLGKSYYGRRQWEKAGRSFGAVLERFPKSRMTASTRLFYALCLYRLDRNLAEAQQYLESIPLDFPQSPEASAAKRHLMSVEKALKKKPKAQAPGEPPAEEPAEEPTETPAESSSEKKSGS